jgi:hypothetical protein
MVDGVQAMQPVPGSGPTGQPVDAIAIPSQTSVTVAKKSISCTIGIPVLDMQQ